VAISNLEVSILTLIYALQIKNKSSDNNRMRLISWIHRVDSNLGSDYHDHFFGRPCSDSDVHCFIHHAELLSIRNCNMLSCLWTVYNWITIPHHHMDTCFSLFLEPGVVAYTNDLASLIMIYIYTHTCIYIYIHMYICML
jgi:hypothetical protein